MPQLSDDLADVGKALAKKPKKNYANGRKRHLNGATGRKPRKLAPEIVDQICADIALGLAPSSAFAGARIDPSDFQYWKGLADKGRPDAVELLARFAAADAEFEADNLRTISAAASRTWQAAAWLPERTKQD